MFRPARPITPDEIAAYHTAGVVLLRGILDLRAVNSLRRHIDDATESLHTSPAGYDLSAVTRAYEAEQSVATRADGQYDVAALVDYVRAVGETPLVDERVGKSDGSFLLDTAISSRLAGFKQACLRGALPEIATALLQSDVVNFLGDQIFVKEPRTREKTAFHQDAPYFEIEGEQCCVLWVPVDPVTAKNGAMRYVRGSHKSEALSAPNLFVTNARMPGSEGEALPDIDADPDRYDVVSFDTEPGDIIVHHYKTIHGAGGNLSRYQVRRAASVRYCGDDIRFRSRPGVPPQLHHTVRLEDGDRLCEPDFPIVYRKPEPKPAAA